MERFSKQNISYPQTFYNRIVVTVIPFGNIVSKWFILSNDNYIALVAYPGSSRPAIVVTSVPLREVMHSHPHCFKSSSANNMFYFICAGCRFATTWDIYDITNT